MDSIIAEERCGYQSADLHLEEQQDPTEDRNLAV